MAITTNNVQNVKFLRNGNLYGSRDAARAALEANKALGLDGSAILARYSGGTVGQEDFFIKTLVGFVYADGTNTTVTIFDVDDAGADVEKKIEEIMDILGDGVGSGDTETVSAQLAALSGNNESTSADTSVEGAKRYADQILSDTISALDYSGVTTDDGVYVTNVTEADGVVAATTATLPTVAEISEAGKPIIAVAEDKGTIAASAGTIDAEFVNIADSGEKFTATNVEGALAEIATEIDGMDLEAVSGDGKVITMVAEDDGKVSAEATLVKDVKLTGYEKTSATGAIAATDDIEDALSKLENKTAAITINDEDGSINVTPTTSGTDISVNIKSGEHVLAKDGGAGVYTDIKLSGITPSSTTVKEEFALIGTDGSQLGASIKVYKDSALYNVYLGHMDDTIAGDPPVVTPGTGDAALCFIYHKEDGTYELVPVNVESFLEESEFASGVTADSTTHIVHGVVDPTSESFLTVGADGFKISGVSGLVENAIDALDADESGSTTHITVGVKEANGVITTVTVAEDDIANASDLAGLSAKTVTEIASSNSSITVATAATTAADGTVKYDVITDASKIQMSGFTAAESGFTEIEQFSSVTEAFKAVETYILDNEEVVSNSLNDLNARINELSGGTSADLAAEIAARKAVDGQNGDIYAANGDKVYISGATSLNDADIKLNDALAALDADAIKQVKVNGSGLTETEGAVNINISATNGTGAASTPLIVDTDSNGAVTIKLEGLDCGTY